MAITGSSSKLEYRNTVQIPLSGATAVPAGATNEYPLTRTDRKIRFRDIALLANQTVSSSAPATNHMRLEIWNFTDATKMAQATIVGISGGVATTVRRAVPKSIATLNQFLQSNAEVAAEKVISAKWVGTQTLNRGFVGPQIELVGDLID